MENLGKDGQNIDVNKIEELEKSIQKAADEQVSSSQEKPQEEAQENEDIHHENIPDLAHWEEFSKDNSVVKKYITYISKDFVDIMDRMSTDERSAYINDAIQKKIDLENVELQMEKKRAAIIHVILAIATLIIAMPFVLIGVNKAIMNTFDNYKYSQDNFERLYKHRFEKEKAYIKTLQHNLINKDANKK